jgi:predicted alpha/beta hydrolase family esterase
MQRKWQHHHQKENISSTSHDVVIVAWSFGCGFSAVVLRYMGHTRWVRSIAFPQRVR